MTSEQQRCGKPGCGALERIGNPCTDWDCPQKYVVAAEYRRLQEALAAAEAREAKLREGLRVADEWLSGWASAEPYRAAIQQVLSTSNPLPTRDAETRKKALEEAAADATDFREGIVSAARQAIIDAAHRNSGASVRSALFNVESHVTNAINRAFRERVAAIRSLSADEAQP